LDRIAVLFVAASMSACAPPDAPERLSSSLPPEVAELLMPDTVRTLPVSDGVWYRYLWSPQGPWAVHILESSLGHRCDLALDVLRAAERESGGRGHERVSSMVERAGAQVLAAVNADFFTPEGTVVGTEVVDGRVTSARARPTLSWRPGRDPWIGIAHVRDGRLDAGWGIALGGGDGESEAVGGFPELISEGARVDDLGVSERPGFAASRHPRTAVGFDPATGRLWLLVVDGRQLPHSSGMTLPELASLLEALGATEAINLDGGGSSVMVVRGRAMSHPSDKTGERPVVNALALLRDPTRCRLSGTR
jgi:Phosphodiester glycosidase